MSNLLKKINLAVIFQDFFFILQCSDTNVFVKYKLLLQLRNRESVCARVCVRVCVVLEALTQKHKELITEIERKMKQTRVSVGIFTSFREGVVYLVLFVGWHCTVLSVQDNIKKKKKKG